VLKEIFVPVSIWNEMEVARTAKVQKKQERAGIASPLRMLIVPQFI
jgi:hypothetical protein